MQYKFKLTKKRVWIAVIVFLLAKYYFGFLVEFIQVSGENGTIAMYNAKEKRLIIEQKIVVVNYPNNIIARRIIIGLYDWMYPLTEGQKREAMESAAKRYKKENGYSVGMKVTKYSRVFFRETDDTPRDWNGESDTRKEGRESDHYQDLIAEIIWIEGGSKEYRTLYKGFYYGDD